MFKAVLDLIFPPYCLACNANLEVGESLICTNCRFDLPLTNSHLTSDAKLEQKFYGKVKVESVNAYLKFVKGGKVQRLLHHLKYKGEQEVGEMLGRMYATVLKEVNMHERIDLIVPVPLHKKKLSMRGYNQADCIAKGMSEVWGVPWTANVLQKGRPTESQTKQADRYQRYKNINDVFYINLPEQVRNKRIALVDDIVTTGSTLESCANELLLEGASEIHIMTIATAT
ncbi:MAG: phosphoribosyltransferase family protein [Spirosomataceae bacterium]